MDTKLKTNEAQSNHWNSGAGHAWVAAQELLDGMFKPFEELLVEAAVAGSARRVLDVGCGTGATTLAIARALQADGGCTGIDISAPMIAAARARAECERVPATFFHGDAQVHAFDPARFDMIVSRFGVMFFDDSVRAFANLRRAARHAARLALLAWRDPAENRFMTTAERAAAPWIPNMPVRTPDGPGQFAFADQHRVQRILEQGGWTEIDIKPIDRVCSFPEQALVPYLTRLGPLGRLFEQVEERARDQLVRTVRADFEPYVHGTEVRYVAACWLITGRATMNFP